MAPDAELRRGNKIMSYYSSGHWKQLSRMVKKRDGLQCQICSDRAGDPHCVLHAHHITPRAQGGPDVPENVITLCDLCHAVVTRRWHKPWFGSAAITDRSALEEARQEYLEFLALDPLGRRERQTRLWEITGVRRELQHGSQWNAQ
jgi:5-methylcytosine-specific restriction endonuclease McrA